MNDFDDLSDSALLALYQQTVREISSLDNLQMALKISANSAYGALTNKGFRFFNSYLGESITMLGQYALRTIERDIDAILTKIFKLDKLHKFLIYVDTDSVVGESLVYANGEKQTIASLYQACTKFILKDDFNRNFVKPVNNIVTLSTNIKTGEIEEKPIKYVMKHTVKKRMFKISTGDTSVTVTEDHSVIVLRNQRRISVSPANISKEDKILKIVCPTIGIGVKDERNQENTERIVDLNFR